MVLSGLRSEGARFTSFDPTTAQSTPLTAVAVSPGVISLNLSATDYPNLLVVEERKTSAR